MTSIIWDPVARDFLRKLPKETAKRIFKKIDVDVRENIGRYLKPLINIDSFKIRVGDYRLFADYQKEKNMLIIRSIKHRKNAYKK